MNILIIGAGLIGTTLAKYLSEESHNVVIIDQNSTVVQRIQASLDVLILQGEGTDRALLEEAGLETTDLVLAVTSSDESNIVITLIVHAQNPKARVIARVHSSRYTTNQDLWHKELLGQTVIISPRQAACERIRHLVEVDHAFEVIPFLNGTIQIAGFRLGEKSPLVGRTLKEIGALTESSQGMALGESKERAQILVVAASRQGRVYIPKGTHAFQVRDRVYITTVKGAALGHALHFLGKPSVSNRNIVIAGGGSMGHQIAKDLDAKGWPVTLIEKNMARGRFLAGEQHNVTILHGDATDAALQREIMNAGTTFIALTGHQEVNFLVSILAHKVGAKRAITLMDNETYLAMASTMGIDAVVSPKLATVGSILRFIRKGKVIDAAPMLDGQLEAILIEIQPGSALQGVPLKEANIPKDILVGAVVRADRIHVPNGETILVPRDKVLLIAPRKRHAKTDRFLSSEF